MGVINDSVENNFDEQQRFFLASVVNTSKDSVVTVDFDGIITSWNKAAENLYGYPGNEAIGKNLSLVVLPDDIQQLFLNIERIKNSRAVEIYDTIRVHKGGEQMNLEVVLSPVKNDRDEVIGVSTVARNITERVKAQDALEKSEARFRALISQTAVGIYQADLNRVVTLVNDTLCAMFRFTREELIGKPLWVTTFEEDVELEKGLFEEFKRTTRSFEIDKRVIRKGGDVRWMKESVSAIYNPGSEPLSTMGVIIDITDAKLASIQLENTVRDRTSQLERSNIDLLQFAHVASHDLKEPLRKIGIFTNRLKHEHRIHLPASAQSYLEKIHGAVERMNSMIDGVLSYSKVNADQVRIEAIDLNLLIENIEKDLEVLIQEKSATIQAVRLPILSGSPVLIHQLFYNLISNSLKFSKPTVPPVISIKSEVVKRNGEDFVVLEISDNGIGFEQRFAKQIFEVFTRLHSKDKYEGTGLGLALCYKMVQRHGGTIEAIGRPGEGATFRAFLPKVQQNLR